MTTLLTLLGLSHLFRRRPAVADDRLDAGRLARLEAMVAQLQRRLLEMETENRLFLNTSRRTATVLTPNR